MKVRECGSGSSMHRISDLCSIQAVSDLGNDSQKNLTFQLQLKDELI